MCFVSHAIIVTLLALAGKASAFAPARIAVYDRTRHHSLNMIDSTSNPIVSENLVADDFTLDEPLLVTSDAKAWIRRLNSKTDTFNSHKISGATLTLSGLVVLGTGAITGFDDNIPLFLEPWTLLFCAASLLQMLSSFNMAYAHRSNEREVRNVFMNVGLTCFLLAFSAYYSGPFANSQELFDTYPLLGKGFFGATSAVGIVLGVDAFANFGNLLQSQLKQDRAIVGMSENERLLRASLSIIPYLVALPLNVCVMYFLAYLMDHATVMGLLNYSDLTLSMGANFYQLMFASFGLSYGPLFITLRDKKLISKVTELSLTLAFSLPVLYCIIGQFNQFLHASIAMQQGGLS